MRGEKAGIVFLFASRTWEAPRSGETWSIDVYLMRIEIEIVIVEWERQ